MNNHFYIVICSLLIVNNLWSQDLICEDFIIGEFYIPETSASKNYTISTNDSIKKYEIKRDQKIQKYIVIREKNTQTEWKNGLNKGDPTYEKIEWIDKCSYRLTYDDSKMELDLSKKWVNKNNGIVVSMINIKNKCMSYDATMTTNEGQTISQLGEICKK